jgi:3-oxoacyl-[acyl-carrier-protein] synthase-3
MTFTRVIGTGSYLPNRVLTNTDIEKMVDTSHEWIMERTGIERRHIAADDETTADLAFKACEQALEMAGVSIDDIDMIIVATTTPDKCFPGVACLLQQKFQLHRAIPAFDIQAACSGFIYALSIADQYIRHRVVKRALIVGAECMSRIVDWSDRATVPLFGDGAGAAVLEASDSPGVYSVHLHADGCYADILYANNGMHPSLSQPEPYKIQMAGREVFKIAVNTLNDLVTESLAANQMTPDDIDWLIPHQANSRIILAAAKKLNLPLERVVMTVNEHGNTSAASIPLALDVAVRDGRVKQDDILLLETFGAGLTWGSALIKF